MIPDPMVDSVETGDTVSIDLDSDYERENGDTIVQAAKMMKPWRKGPFRIGSLHIDSEWRSDIKYNLLEPHFDLTGKIVGDIGCNNGYYLFRMLGQKPEKLVGFDPSPLYYSQFSFIDRFVKSGIVYELLGVEHVEYYEHDFDTLFCLGVLYHRSDPIGTLKSLRKALKKDGELFLDTFMIEGEDEICLFPAGRYSMIPNVYFIPTTAALKNWCMRVGFSDFEVLHIKKTDSHEQRKSDWIDTHSLEDFLDPRDQSKTLEGYPAPRRIYIKVIR